jgi:hypothetical protein
LGFDTQFFLCTICILINEEGEQHGSQCFWLCASDLPDNYPSFVFRSSFFDEEICKNRKVPKNRFKVDRRDVAVLDLDQPTLAGLPLRGRTLGADHTRQLLRHDEPGFILVGSLGQKG